MTTAGHTEVGTARAAAAAIVVGHDGSANSDMAIESALVLAERLGAPVALVRTWSIDTALRPPGWTFGYVSSFGEMSTGIEEALAADVSTRLLAHPGVVVTLTALHSSPAKGLIDFSQDAQMLVVGSRGLGGFAGMLLGSVSTQCVQYAACPVLVVHSRRINESSPDPAKQTHDRAPETMDVSK